MKEKDRHGAVVVRGVVVSSWTTEHPKNVHQKKVLLATNRLQAVNSEERRLGAFSMASTGHCHPKHAKQL